MCPVPSVVRKGHCRCPRSTDYCKKICEPAGWTVPGLLARLNDVESNFAISVTDADIDVVTIGANDFTPSHQAVVRGEGMENGNTECMQDELEQMRSSVCGGRP